MLISTTDRIPGQITEIKGIVHAALMKAFTKDPAIQQLPGKKWLFLPWIKSIDQDAMIGYLIDQANEILAQKAGELGANAVISVNYKFDLYWNLGVVAYGTAIVVENDTVKTE